MKKKEKGKLIGLIFLIKDYWRVASSGLPWVRYEIHAYRYKKDRTAFTKGVRQLVSKQKARKNNDKKIEKIKKEYTTAIVNGADRNLLVFDREKVLAKINEIIDRFNQEEK